MDNEKTFSESLSIINFPLSIKDGELAQLGERLLCTQEVSGSIPLFSTNAETQVKFSKRISLGFYPNVF